jgi:hypothetical protein
MENVRTILEHHALVFGLEFGLANRANLFLGHSVNQIAYRPRVVTRSDSQKWNVAREPNCRLSYETF